VSYVIDGHNLIPKVPGLDLSDPEDELRLIEVLQDFCRHTRKSVEVYFDQAPPGMSGSRSFGLVKARFIRQGQTADQAIQNRLEKLGRRASQYTVVSSDRQVALHARSLHARVLSAEDFIRLLQQAAEEPRAAAPVKPDPALSPDEVQEWLDLFQEGEDGAKLD
jgi:predicted RNA-binding protein with PIN domain